MSSYGKPTITSEDDPDPDNDWLRYAEWDSPVDNATDVLKLVQYKPSPKYKYFIPVFIERRPTRILQMEMKSRMEWKKNYGGRRRRSQSCGCLLSTLCVPVGCRQSDTSRSRLRESCCRRSQESRRVLPEGVRSLRKGARCSAFPRAAWNGRSVQEIP